MSRPSTPAGTRASGSAPATVPDVAASGSDPSPRPNQRQRIIDNALALMADQGVAATSMRQLARACDINVAAIYHYFPSKDDLFLKVIEERQYHLRLRDLPVVDLDQPPREVFTQLIEEIWLGSIAEEGIWRLLLGESMRGNPNAVAAASELLTTIETALTGWLTTLFPDLGDRADAAAAVVLGQLYASFMEHLFVPNREISTVRDRADHLAALLFDA